MPDATVCAIPETAIAEWKPYDKPGALRGFITITIAPGILIHGLKVFEKAAERWIGMPNREYKKRDGSTAYAPIVEFATRELEQEFRRAVLAALDRYLEGSDVQ